MKKRQSCKLEKRREPVIGKCTLGSTVDFQCVMQYVPAEVLERFKEAINMLSGKKTNDLSIHERKFVEMIIIVANEYLIVEVLSGKYDDNLWTPELRKIIMRHQKRTEDQPLEVMRIKYRELRRKWFQQMRDLMLCMNPQK